MSQPEERPTDDGRSQPTDQDQRQRGWRRILLLALLVAALVLVGASGAGFAAGRVLAGDDGPVRCASWDINRCIPGLDLDAVLATLSERGFECNRRERREEVASLTSAQRDECRLAGFQTTLESLNGQVHNLSASVPALPDVSPTPQQEAFLSWVAVLPFAAQPASAEAASRWLSERLASGIDNGMNIDGYDYSFRDSGPDRGALVLEIDAGVGGWLR